MYIISRPHPIEEDPNQVIYVQEIDSDGNPAHTSKAMLAAQLSEADAQAVVKSLNARTGKNYSAQPYSQ